MEWKKLGEVTNNLDSLRKPLNNSDRQKISKKKLYPYYGANNIIDYVDEYIFDDEILCVAEDGGSWGYNEVCSYIVNGKCWVNNHAHVLTAKSSVDIKYISYYLNYGDLSRHITGSTRGKLNKSELNKVKIPVPPLSIQKKIVSVLDVAQVMIDKRKEQIELLDKMIKSIFYEMFGDIRKNNKNWEQKNFKDICKVNQGLQIPISKRKNKSAENRYKYITIQYLNGKKDIEYIENPSKNVICNKDDILMTRTGNTGMVITGVEGVFHNNFFIIDYDEKLLSKQYLVKYLRSNYIQSDIIRRAGSSTIPDLNHGEFYKIKILLPPLHLQNEFAQKVEKIEKQKELFKQSLKIMEDNYNSLMQRAFKGELFK